MTTERKIFLGALGVVVAAVVVLLVWPRVSEELAPQPTLAWVALEVGGSGIAEVGPVTIAPKTPFRLHAVLEAERRDGSKVYYTEAPALRLGGEDVPAAALERWKRPARAKVLWFTVEGELPHLRLAPGEDLSRFRLKEYLRPDWAQAWSIPGHLEPAFDDHLALPVAESLPFGTQRYHVRIELYGPESDLVPERRFRSWGAEEARQRPEVFPTVVAQPEGAFGTAASYFGLTQIDSPPVSGNLLPELVELTAERLAFSRTTLLAAILRERGLEVGQLAWRLIELDGSLAWGSEISPGDLLRVGNRWVVLYRDADGDGRLGRGDLCFDYVQGATVEPLSDVFAGSGEVEWAALGNPAEPTG